MPEKQILISAGEASSDMYAARLVTALRERTQARFFGMGGPRMAEAGVDWDEITRLKEAGAIL